MGKIGKQPVAARPCLGSASHLLVAPTSYQVGRPPTRWADHLAGRPTISLSRSTSSSLLHAKKHKAMSIQPLYRAAKESKGRKNGSVMSLIQGKSHATNYSRTRGHPTTCMVGRPCKVLILHVQLLFQLPTDVGKQDQAVGWLRRWIDWSPDHGQGQLTPYMVVRPPPYPPNRPQPPTSTPITW